MNEQIKQTANAPSGTLTTDVPLEGPPDRGGKPAPGPGSVSKTKSEKQPDNLLAALEQFCRHHRIPFSAERALHGLPLEAGVLRPRNFVRASQNLGLLSEARKLTASNANPMVFPVMVFFRNADVGILREKKPDGTLKVSVFARSGESSERTFDARSLDAETIPTLFLVSKNREGEGRAGSGQQEKGYEIRDEPHWFWSVVSRFWPNWTYVILATFLVNVLGLALPLFVMNVYDRVIPNNSIPTLWALVIGVSIALFFDFMLRMVRSAMVDNSGKRIDLGISARIFDQALDAKLSARKSGSGELANHVREFDTVRDFFSSGAIVSLIDLLFIGVFLAFLWFIVGPLALVPLVAVPVVLLATILVQVPLSRSVRRSQSASGSRHSVLIDALISIETVKSISAEGALQQRWEEAVTAAARAGASTRFWSSFAVYLTMFAQQAVSVIIIAWGVFLVASGDITIGALIAANILAGRILAPLGGISGTLVRAQQSIAAMTGIDDLMKLERDNPKTRGRGAEIHSGRIEFRDLGFTYPGQLEPALEHISLSIAPGERVGIIGRVGSGKSTFGKLLGGLYEPTSGGVLVDGTDTRHHDMANLRRKVAYVGQETELFSGTLRDNLLMARPENAEHLEPCLTASGVANFTSRHPLGLEMPIGERGRSLSGGQRQAVGIARALLADPEILFLDEPTAQMDTMTEAAFVSGFRQWLKPRSTVLIATHRNTLLDLVDRLVVVENGTIIADGPKAVVLRKLEAKVAVPKAGGPHAAK